MENLCKGLLKNNEISGSFLLYEKLYEIFIENLIWKRQKSISLSETKTSGIYIIYNKESLITYEWVGSHLAARSPPLDPDKHLAMHPAHADAYLEKLET